MTGKKRGRPKWVPTPEILEQVTQLASQGLTQEQIAYNIDLSPQTMSGKVQEFPELSEAIKKGKSKGIAFVTNRLLQLVQEKHPAAIFFWLKCQAGWKENDPAMVQTQPLTIKVNGKVVEMD